MPRNKELSIREWGWSLNHAPLRRRYFMVLTFHADESYDKLGFVFGGWLGDQKQWERLERQWLKRLEFERRNGRPLTRFHATNCDALQDEYKSWSKDDAKAHVTKLVSIIKRRAVGVVAAGVDLKALVEVFPGDKRDPIAAAYDLAVRETMILMGRGIKKFLHPETKVTILFDRGPYQGIAQRAFNKMKGDPRWPNRELFVACAPMCWQDCVPLQPADLLAFDTRRSLYARLKYNSVTMRRSLRELVDDGSHRPVMARYFDKRTLQKLKDIHLAESYHHEEGLHVEEEQGVSEVRQSDGTITEGSTQRDKGQAGRREGGEDKKAEG